MKLAAILMAFIMQMAATASADEPTAKELIAKYDAAMGPPRFGAVMVMTAHREDGSTRSYRLEVLKAGTDKIRSSFLEPAASRGQEILRQGENLWIYMPDLKRSIRLANRDSFQGGDFNNADILRVNYSEDYEGKVVADPATPSAWLLELRARTDDAAYDRIKLWMDRASSLPIRGEYYTASGKLLRAAEFTDVKDFQGLRRPAKIRMNNMIARKRYSEIAVDKFDTSVNPPSRRFVLDDLGR